METARKRRKSSEINGMNGNKLVRRTPKPQLTATIIPAKVSHINWLAESPTPKDGDNSISSQFYRKSTNSQKSKLAATAPVKVSANNSFSEKRKPKGSAKKTPMKHRANSEGRRYSRRISSRKEAMGQLKIDRIRESSQSVSDFCQLHFAKRKKRNSVVVTEMNDSCLSGCIEKSEHLNCDSGTVHCTAKEEINASEDECTGMKQDGCFDQENCDGLMIGDSNETGVISEKSTNNSENEVVTDALKRNANGLVNPLEHTLLVDENESGYVVSDVSDVNYVLVQHKNESSNKKTEVMERGNIEKDKILGLTSPLKKNPSADISSSRKVEFTNLKRKKPEVYNFSNSPIPFDVESSIVKENRKIQFSDDSDSSVSEDDEEADCGGNPSNLLQEDSICSSSSNDLSTKWSNYSDSNVLSKWASENQEPLKTEIVNESWNDNSVFLDKKPKKPVLLCVSPGSKVKKEEEMFLRISDDSENDEGEPEVKTLTNEKFQLLNPRRLSKNNSNNFESSEEFESFPKLKCNSYDVSQTFSTIDSISPVQFIPSTQLKEIQKSTPKEVIYSDDSETEPCEESEEEEEEEKVVDIPVFTLDDDDDDATVEENIDGIYTVWSSNHKPFEKLIGENMNNVKKAESFDIGKLRSPVDDSVLPLSVVGQDSEKSVDKVTSSDSGFENEKYGFLMVDNVVNGNVSGLQNNADSKLKRKRKKRRSEESVLLLSDVGKDFDKTVDFANDDDDGVKKSTEDSKLKSKRRKKTGKCSDESVLCSSPGPDCEQRIKKVRCVKSKTGGGKKRSSDIKAFNNLEINITWELNRLHQLPMSSSDGDELIELKRRGFKISAGHYTKEEIKTLKNNWKRFRKEHKFDNFYLMMATRKSLNNPTAKEKKLNFIRYLGRGLNDRPLQSIRHKSFTYILPKHKQIFTREDIQRLQKLRNICKRKWMGIKEILNSYLTKGYATTSSEKCEGKMQCNEDQQLMPINSEAKDNSTAKNSEFQDFLIHSNENSNLVGSSLHDSRGHWFKRLYEALPGANGILNCKMTIADMLRLVRRLKESNVDKVSNIDWKKLNEDFPCVSDTKQLKKICFALFRTISDFRTKSLKELLELVEDQLSIAKMGSSIMCAIKKQYFS